MCLMTVQQNSNYSTSTVVMHKKAIEILSENDLSNWLFYFQKYLLTMKIMKFN